MNRQEIENAVDAYLRNSNYALLISGKWGIGKTYLYMNCLKSKIEKWAYGKKWSCIYTSLYGIASIETLSEALVKQLISKEDNKSLSTCIDKAIVFLKKIPAAFYLKKVPATISFKKIPISVEFSKFFDYFFNIKDAIICFDDLERCLIPVNEIFGYMNNLIEHCNCKVIILADEENIGKIYANTNIEQKYITVLSGGRKIVADQSDHKGKENNTIGSDISIQELKELTEQIYSDNYIYKDIKEKVIGQTCPYTPDLKESIQDIIKAKYGDSSLSYRTFLEHHLDLVVNNFSDIDISNLRIIISWIESFKKIYDEMERLYKEHEYYEDIISIFIKYSIWVITDVRLSTDNIKVELLGTFEWAHRGELEPVLRSFFIDKYVRKGLWDEENFGKAVILIETNIKQRKYEEEEKKEAEKERERNNQKIVNSYTELLNWKYMEDDEVKDLAAKLFIELKNGQYRYEEYFDILQLFIILKEVEVSEIDISEVQHEMKNLIRNDTKVQEEKATPPIYYSEEIAEEHRRYYDPISQARKEKNIELEKKEMNSNDSYKSADNFLKFCKNNDQYFYEHHSFMQYVDLDELIKLINRSNPEEIRKELEGINSVFHLGKLEVLYKADVERLKVLRSKLGDKTQTNREGKIRCLAIDDIIALINKVLKELWAE